MIEVREQCKKCFHFQVCADVLKQQLYIKEMTLEEKNVSCKHFVPNDIEPYKNNIAKEMCAYLKKHLKIKRDLISFPSTNRDTRNYQCGATDTLNYFDDVASYLEEKYVKEIPTDESKTN